MTRTQIMSSAETFLARNLPTYYQTEDDSEKLEILLKEIGKVDGVRAREIESNLRLIPKNSIEGQAMNLNCYEASVHWRS